MRVSHCQCAMKQRYHGLWVVYHPVGTGTTARRRRLSGPRSFQRQKCDRSHRSHRSFGFFFRTPQPTTRWGGRSDTFGAFWATRGWLPPPPPGKYEFFILRFQFRWDAGTLSSSRRQGLCLQKQESVIKTVGNRVGKLLGCVLGDKSFHLGRAMASM